MLACGHLSVVGNYNIAYLMTMLNAGLTFHFWGINWVLCFVSIIYPLLDSSPC
jgi:hypothetical protein